MRQIQTSGLERGEQILLNAEKKNRGNMEEYMVRAEILVDSVDAWQMVGITARFDLSESPCQSGP